MKPTARALAHIVLAIVPIAALALVAPWVHVRVLLGLAIGFVVASATFVLGAAGVTRAFGESRSVYALAIVGFVAAGTGYWISHAGHGAVWLEVLSGLVATLGVIALGCAAGITVGARIIDPAHVLAVALASSAADVWSVHSPRGVTHAVVVAQDVALQRMLTVSAAIPPDRVPAAAIGIGDVIFAALYLAVAARHRLARNRMVAAIAIGLLLAGAATFALRRPMPALPFIGALVVLFEPRTRKVARHDRLATAIAAALFVGSVVFVLKG